MNVNMLKGAAGASLVWAAAAGIGLYFLHRRHEEELDELQRDTARDCLDFAAEHYERVLRNREETNIPAAAEEVLSEKTEALRQDIAATGGNIPEDAADWDERIRRLREEFDSLQEEFLEKQASLGIMEARRRFFAEEERFRQLQAEADLVGEELRQETPAENG
jgi:hypothetical protein